MSVEAGAPVLPEPPPRLEPTTPSKPIGPVRSVFTLGSIKWTRNGEVCTAGRHITINLPLDLVEMAIKNGYAIENTAVNAARIEDLRNLCPPDFASVLARDANEITQPKPPEGVRYFEPDGTPMTLRETSLSERQRLQQQVSAMPVPYHLEPLTCRDDDERPNDTPPSIAVHEASHCAAAAAYDLEVNHVAIGHGPPGYPHRDKMCGYTWFADRQIDPWGRAVVAFAGEAADQIFFNLRPAPESQDHRDAVRMLHQLPFVNVANCPTMVEEARAAAREVVKTNKSRIFKLARELDYYGRLDGSDVAEILGAIIPGPSWGDWQRMCQERRQRILRAYAFRQQAGKAPRSDQGEYRHRPATVAAASHVAGGEIPAPGTFVFSPAHNAEVRMPERPADGEWVYDSRFVGWRRTG